MMSDFTERLLGGPAAPLLIEAQRRAPDLAELVRRQREYWDGRLLERGALLFRGFGACSMQLFDRLIGAWTADRLDCVFGSTPRQAVGDRIFTATEYPAALEIPLHNEDAYQRQWPLKIAFCCLQPAMSGGETPIADMRLVGRALGEELLDIFEARGVKYVRHYHAGIDMPWQQVFGTDDRAALARICTEYAIEHHWLPDQTLRTAQNCQGTARHPVTGERVFFNQAHLFHVSSLGPELSRSMMGLFGTDRLPRQAYFGDGEEIPATCLARIRAAFQQASCAFPWAQGDVLLLDNMRYAHGRRPFKGARRVLAALMELHAPQIPVASQHIANRQPQ
jgi:hypothetical protein